jgi:hypothetical protein
MKIVRLGMTEGGLLLMTFVSRYCNPDPNTKMHISRNVMSLMNWLYTTSGYYDKSVKGNHFNFDQTALNQRFFQFIGHLEQSINGCEQTHFFFHDGFIMGLFHQHKDKFIRHYNIRNLIVLNGSKFVDRIPGIFQFMEGKRVLVISSFSGIIQSQYDSGNVYKVYDFFPKLNGVETVTTPYCFLNDGPHQNYFETLDAIFEEVKTKNFDFALLGCGAYGHMLCHRIHSELGKEAFYIGGSVTNLFGILSTRERIHSNLKTNEYWITEIPDEYKPSNYKMIENGCYW